jgi:hypothetical protein
MSDALERLKGRNRPTVPARNSALTPDAQESETSTLLEHKISKSQDIEISTLLEHKISKSQDIEESLSDSVLNTKQTTFRLELALSERLQETCRDSGICREALIEAMFEYCEKDPKALRKVLKEALKKNDYRLQVANARRAQSMMHRFG